MPSVEALPSLDDNLLLGAHKTQVSLASFPQSPPYFTLHHKSQQKIKTFGMSESFSVAIVNERFIVTLSNSVIVHTVQKN